MTRPGAHKTSSVNNNLSPYLSRLLPVSNDLSLEQKEDLNKNFNHSGNTEKKFDYILEDKDNVSNGHRIDINNSCTGCPKLSDSKIRHIESSILFCVEHPNKENY